MTNSPHRRFALVTGGAGFIGSHLVESLLAEGCRVVVIDDESTGSATNLPRHPALTSERASAGDAARLRQWLPQVDEVYHLAAAVGVALIAEQPTASIERNILPTQTLLHELRRVYDQGHTPRLFLASSSEVYGKNPRPTWSEDDDLVFGGTQRPRWSYGMSKAIDEFLVLGSAKEWGLRCVVGRFFNVVGPRQTGAYGMVLPRFVDAALAGRPLLVHDDGRQTRCFAHVRDVVAAVTALMSMPVAWGEVFNIGSDQPVTIGELAERVIALAGSDSRIEHQTYAAAYDAQFEDVRHRVPQLDKLRRFVPQPFARTLEETIRDVIAWRRGG